MASGPVEIVMPRMGLTMEEGTVVAWLKPENATVTSGEPLLEIETDKSTVEIEAPASGRLGRILVPAGGTVPVGEVIGYLYRSDEVYTTPSTPTNTGEGAAVEGKVKASPAARALARRLNVDLVQAAASGPDGRVVAWNVQELADAAAVEARSAKVSPLAKKVAAEMGVDASKLAGAGPSGWVRRADVQRAASVAAPDLEDAMNEAATPTVALVPGQVTPLTRAHKVMAERMVASFGSAPHFYLHVDVDCRRLAALRAQLLSRLEARYHARPSYTDFLVKYTGLVLLRHPRLLQQWAGNGLTQFERADIGLAMDTSAGLVVPVIRDAARLDLVEITRQRLALAERAQSAKLQPQDVELGVFTISNLGMFGIDAFDAILNPPQAAILAVGRIKERPMVVDGQVIAALGMTLSLSVDHRVLDGATAARFLGDLAELIEQPELAVSY